jgi:hypothetical protein
MSSYHVAIGGVTSSQQIRGRGSRGSAPFLFLVQQRQKRVRAGRHKTGPNAMRRSPPPPPAASILWLWRRCGLLPSPPLPSPLASWLATGKPCRRSSTPICSARPSRISSPSRRGGPSRSMGRRPRGRSATSASQWSFRCVFLCGGLAGRLAKMGLELEV